MTKPSALLVDFGGVLTNDISDCIDDFCVNEGIDPAGYDAVIAQWLGEGGSELARNPAYLLERGELTESEFEAELAALLAPHARRPLRADGMLTRMFAASRHEPAMISVVRRARRNGVRTALLSNSWSMNVYDRASFAELFDAVVISGEVAMRKPEPEIYLHTARMLDVAPGACVFVDDIASNVHGAVAVGMVGIHHRSAAETTAELTVLFGDALAPGLRGA